MPGIKKLGRSIDGGRLGLKFFKIILFQHGTTTYSANHSKTKSTLSSRKNKLQY